LTLNGAIPLVKDFKKVTAKSRPHGNGARDYLTVHVAIF